MPCQCQSNCLWPFCRLKDMVAISVERFLQQQAQKSQFTEQHPQITLAWISNKGQPRLLEINFLYSEIASQCEVQCNHLLHYVHQHSQHYNNNMMAQVKKRILECELIFHHSSHVPCLLNLVK